MSIESKKLVIAGAMASVLLGFTQTASALTAYYQPTPYPSVNSSGTHIWDGWLRNMNGTNFQWSDILEIGGWGDQYRSYVKFDSVGLPDNVTQAVLWLYPYGTTNPVNIGFNSVTGSWTPSMTWATQPSATFLGYVTAPTANMWWGTIITPWYNAWASSPSTNYGLRLDTSANNNNFSFFRSSRYATDVNRPILQLDFTPPVSVPSFLMPLPGNRKWLVTTEAGGWDCLGNYDPAHVDGSTPPNYFSIDFTFTGSGYTANSNIPIIASASGKVVESGYNAYNGNYISIDHDGDGNLNTGFSTRYLHMRDAPLVAAGATVQQGDLLGYMGNTGDSHGIHLHFGTRYANSGASNSMVRYVVNNGWLLKSYQTECIGGTWARYYTSNNRAY